MNRHGGSRRSAIRPLLHSSILFRPHQQPPKPVSDWRLVVEAPGYCPPGPKCLFHLTIYRHSRLPGPRKIGVSAWNHKETHWKHGPECCYADSSESVSEG